MKKIVVILVVLTALIIGGLFIPIKTSTTDGGCDIHTTKRYNLIFGEKIPPSQSYNSVTDPGGCGPITKHIQYLL